jgi:hypothetical protein
MKFPTCSQSCFDRVVSNISNQPIPFVCAPDPAIKSFALPERSRAADCLANAFGGSAFDPFHHGGKWMRTDIGRHQAWPWFGMIE